MKNETTGTCPNCNGPVRFDRTSIVRDPLYHGPNGHAPPEICAACWAEWWEDIKTRMEHEGRWEPIHEAVWQLAQGAGHQRAAEIARMHRTTRWRKLRAWRQNPALVPDWLLVRVQLRLRWRQDPAALR